MMEDTASNQTHFGKLWAAGNDNKANYAAKEADQLLCWRRDWSGNIKTSVGNQQFGRSCGFWLWALLLELLWGQQTKQQVFSMLGTSTKERPITSCKTAVRGTSMIASWLGRNNGIGWVALPCLALSEGRFPFELDWQLCGGGWGCQFVATFNYNLRCNALGVQM